MRRGEDANSLFMRADCCKLHGGAPERERQHLVGGGANRPPPLIQYPRKRRIKNFDMLPRQTMRQGSVFNLGDGAKGVRSNPLSKPPITHKIIYRRHRSLSSCFDANSKRSVPLQEAPPTIHFHANINLYDLSINLYRFRRYLSRKHSHTRNIFATITIKAISYPKAHF